MTTYPINFNFGEHWYHKVSMHLNNPQIKKSIIKGVNSYLAMFPNKKKYKKYTPPALYSPRNLYSNIIDKQVEKIINDYRYIGKLPASYIELEKKCNDPDKIDSYEQNYDKLLEMQANIVSPYFTWDKLKYRLESYFLCGGCFWWAPTFEITLAQLVEPNEKWRIMSSNKHTTVINENNTKIFDLLYWGGYNRLENFIFGDDLYPLKNNDITLGGKDAFIDASPDNELN